MGIAPARAGQQAEIAYSLKGIYDIRLSDIRFAKLGLELEQTATSYDIICDVAITGLLKFFTKHSSHTTVSASGKDFVYPSRSYESKYKTRKKSRHVKMLYENGQTKKETSIPPVNTAKRKQPTPEQRKDHYDPLSFLIKMRQEVIGTLKENNKGFMLKVFDGRRLTGAQFTIIGEKTISYKGKERSVIAVKIKRSLISGYTQKEYKTHSSKEKPLTVYFSNDERFIPLKLETNFWFSTLSATLAKECRTGESCLFGLK